jgi:hypothetical protein
MHIGLHVKYPLFLPEYNVTCIFSTNFDKNSKIKFHKNPSNGSHVVPCGQRDGHTLKYEYFKIIPSKISDLGTMKWVGKLHHNVGSSGVSTLHRVSQNRDCDILELSVGRTITNVWVISSWTNNDMGKWWFSDHCGSVTGGLYAVR